MEAPQWAKMLPDFPRLAHQFLERRALQNNGEQERLLAQLVVEQRRTNRRLSTALMLVGGFLAGIVLVQALAWAGYW
ncbi:putative ubiquinone biosynthesis protein UbiB [compost metagenome]